MTSRRIVHVDMDAFFASVEQRDDPSLLGKPIAVGGSPWDRGVIATASYEARRFGVRSAMPSSRALKLCPGLILVRPNFARYAAVSDQIQSIFREATPLVEPLSLDEAFLDVTENAWGLALGMEVARKVKDRIFAETGLTASAGVGPNKLVAKIASGHKKPDGLTVVAPEAVDAFLRDLPASSLWGVGEVTSRRLSEAGIHRVSDVRRVGEAKLSEVVGSYAATLLELAHGVDERPVEAEQRRKSIGAEETFPVDLVEPDDVRAEVVRLASDVARWLAEGALETRTVTLKVRYGDFETVTRRSTGTPTSSADEVVARAVSLLARTEAASRPVRLVGVSAQIHDGEDASKEDGQLRLPFP